MLFEKRLEVTFYEQAFTLVETLMIIIISNTTNQNVSKVK